MNHLVAYAGNFLVSPLPLELSFNYCSSACAYCFANLNARQHRERDFDAEGTLEFLATFRERTSLPARLLQCGYPVLVSNRVDPFAHSNYKQAVPFLRVLTDLGIPLSIQTRGGRGIDEALAFLKPAVWYISICQQNDALRRELEPGAPALESRYELIQKLREAGHRVVVGLNPLVPEWLPEPGVVAEKLAAVGAEGAWVTPLHLNSKQAFELTQREQAALTLPLIERARKRRYSPEERAHDQRVRVALDAVAIPSYCGGQHEPTSFWKPYEEVYGTRFPILQEFVNYAWGHLDDGQVLQFDDFVAVMHGLPNIGHANLREYVYVGCRTGSRANNLALRKDVTQLTFTQLLALAWAEPTLAFSPVQLRCFSYAATRGTDGVWERFHDARGLPFVVFHKEPTEEFFVEVSDGDLEPERRSHGVDGVARAHSDAGDDVEGAAGL